MTRAEAIGWTAGAIAVAALPFLLGDNPSVRHIATNIGVYAILATALNLVSGTTGQLSVGHGAFFMVGAYSSALLTVHLTWPVVPALIVGLLIAAALSYLIGYVCLRMSGMYLAMVTVAVSLILVRLALQATNLTGGPDGLPRIPPLLRSREWGSTVTLWVVFSVLLISLRLSWNLIGSHIGRSYFAVRDNALVAASCGVDVAGAKISAFVLSGVLAALAGSLFAHWQNFVSPEQFGLHLSLEILLMMLLGGAGTAFGPLVGAVVLAPLPDLTRTLEHLHPFIYGGLLVLTAIFLPKGIAGLIRKKSIHHGASGASIAELPLEGPKFTERADDGSVVLEVREVSKAFGGLRAVDKVNFEVRKGSIHCVIGPNGSGKTTTVNLITGVLVPDNGSIKFAGAEITALPAHLVARRGLRRTFQAGRVLPEMTVLDNVLLGAHSRYSSGYWASLLGFAKETVADRNLKAEAIDLLRFVGLYEQANALAGGLPTGHQRLLELARVLISRPSLILLDEPAAGLSGVEIDAFRDRLLELRKKGLTILLVEHNQNLVMSIADRVTVLDYGGVIAEGTAAEIQVMPNVIAAYLGADYANAN
jgi:branched-chain amino acid transport system permease protein